MVSAYRASTSGTELVLLWAEPLETLWVQELDYWLHRLAQLWACLMAQLSGFATVQAWEIL